MRPYKALDIADYIVHYCNTTGRRITHIQLQKILYFLEAHYLLKKDRELFQDDIEKWKLGPVVRSVYHEYKTFGSREIHYVPNRLVVESGAIHLKGFNPETIDTEDREEINNIVNNYIQIPPFDLVEATHTHQPWKEDLNKINLGVQVVKYNKEALKMYFKEHPNLLEV